MPTQANYWDEEPLKKRPTGDPQRPELGQPYDDMMLNTEQPAGGGFGGALAKPKTAGSLDVTDAQTSSEQAYGTGVAQTNSEQAFSQPPPTNNSGAAQTNNQPAVQPQQPPPPAPPNPHGTLETVGGMEGVRLTNGAWVPKDHPAAAAFFAQQPPATPPGTPGAPGTSDADVSSNEALQHVRNMLGGRSTQGTADINRNNPHVRVQADSFAAGAERARRNANADLAEGFSAQGSAGSGAQKTAERLTNENTSQAVGQMEAQLVGRELQTRRDEITHALDGLREMAMGELSLAQQKELAQQQMALQKELGHLNASMQQLGITSSSQLGMAELALREKLGMGGLNLDAMRLLTGNRQWENEFGRLLGLDESNMNNAAVRALLGG
jgi:hypothetical protein